MEEPYLTILRGIFIVARNSAGNKISVDIYVTIYGFY
jgi:hypothetical protein